MGISSVKFKGALFLVTCVLFLSTTANGQRCNTDDYNRKYAAKVAASNINQSQSSRNILANEVIIIPVVIHVLYNTPEQNISDAQILSQLQSLNKDFRKLNADTANTPNAFKGVSADAQIVFCLARRDPQGNATSGIIRKYTPIQSWTLDDGMKFSASGGDNAWDAKRYLNIWVCNLFGRSLGYSSLPGSHPDKDGLVIQYNAFGTMGTVAAPFNKGRTATHEAGHWLGLQHLWGDTNCGDDGIDDTPQQQSFNNGCPSFPHKTLCSKNNDGDMFMNFMDFTDDACMNLFTIGQKNKMRSLFTQGGLKNSFLNSTACDSSVIQRGPVLRDTLAAPISVSLYPNPVTNFLVVESNNELDITGKQIKILNMYGTTAITKVLTSQKNYITTAHLPVGIYFLQIGEGDRKKMIKFVKQ